MHNQSLITVINQGRPKEWQSDSPNIQDLHELLALDEVKARTIVWQDEKKKISAFNLVDPFNNLLFECTDNTFYPTLFHEAVLFSCEVIRKEYLNLREIPTLDASIRGGMISGGYSDLKGKVLIELVLKVFPICVTWTIPYCPL